MDVPELIRTFVPGGPQRMQHQQQALQDVIRNKGSHALLMDMGTGKTAVVWDYLSLLALRYGECRVLVVCPKVVRDSWGQQGLKFAHPQVSLWCETLTGLRMDKAKRLQALGVDTAMRMHTEKPEVTLRDAGNPHVRVNPRSLGPGAMRAPRVVMAIANYDTFSSRARQGSKTMADVMLAAVGKFNPHIVVADEGHYARNPSNIGRFMARLGRKVPRRLLLTGTPMPHSPIDILQQWHFVDPDEFVTDHGRPWGRPMFLDRYCNTPDAPILMWDGTFKLLADVQIGDSVMGWRMGEPDKNGGTPRKYFAESVVKNKAVRVADNVLEATLESGHIIKCTRDHQWLSATHDKSGAQTWTTVLGKTTSKLPWERRTDRGEKTVMGSLSRVVDPPRTLTPRQERAAWYIAGMFDGEGDRTTISQSAAVNPDICRRIQEELDILGLNYSISGSRLLRFHLATKNNNLVRMINEVPAEKSVRWANSLRYSAQPGVTYKDSVPQSLIPKGMFRTRDRVVDVRELPPQDVISLETETGNYIAWGLASKNCVLGGWQGKEVIRWRGLDHLQARIAKRATVVAKEDALDLPPITEVVHRFALSSKERGAYRDMAKRMVVSLEAGELTEDNRLVQMLRLRQITSGFVHDTGTGKDEILGTSKLDAAVEILDDVMAGENRAVVFCWSRLEMARLAERFGRGRLWDAQPLLISGQTKDADRKAILERFLNVKANPEKIVVIAQIRTVSVGINEFVSASNVLFLSLSQQREEFLQARDRLHRIGQEKPVTVHVLLAKNSVDGQIWRHYQQRTDLEASILDHVRQVGRSQTMTEGIDVQEAEDGA